MANVRQDEQPELDFSQLLAEQPQEQPELDFSQLGASLPERAVGKLENYVGKEIPQAYSEAAQQTARGLKGFVRPLLPPLSREALRHQIGAPGPMQGLGQTALGMIGQATAPLTAAVKPPAQRIEAATGLPAPLGEAALSSLLPGPGLLRGSAGVRQLPRTVAAAFQHAESLFNDPAVTSVRYHPDMLRRIGQELPEWLRRQDISPSTAPTTMGVIQQELLQNPEVAARGYATTQDLRRARSMLNDTAQQLSSNFKSTPEAVAARQVQHRLDYHLTNPQPQEVLAGDPKKAGPLLQEASRAYAAASQAARFERKNMQLEASLAASGRGSDAPLRALAGREQFKPGYTQAERAALKAVNEGTAGPNTLRTGEDIIGHSWPLRVALGLHTHGLSEVAAQGLRGVSRLARRHLTEHALDRIGQDILQRSGSAAPFAGRAGLAFGVPYSAATAAPQLRLPALPEALSGAAAQEQPQERRFGGLANSQAVQEQEQVKHTAYSSGVLRRQEGGLVPQPEDYEERLQGALPSYSGLGPMLGSAATGATSYLWNIPKRALQASEQLRTTGEYDPGPVLDAAQLGMTGGLGGVTREAREAMLGAGPVLRSALPAAEQATVPVWHSTLEQAAATAKQAKASGDQWLHVLRKQPGVKKEEMEWTGLSDMLAERGKQPVTREEIVDHLRQSRVELQEAQGQPTRYEKWVLPGGENYRELLLTLPQKEPGEGFRSSHWDEPNVLAHVRFNDRQINGKKTLFLEELQSDWHQQGAQQGYQSQRQALLDDVIAKEKASIIAHQFDRPDKAEKLAAYQEASTRLETMEKKGRAIPDAPFKQNAWHDLLLKRMARYAAENGYDQMAWTPGQVQADRYSLSNHIHELRYRPTSNGLIQLQALSRTGADIPLPHTAFRPHELDDVVGREVAERIRQDSTAQLQSNPPVNPADLTSTRLQAGDHHYWHLETPDRRATLIPYDFDAATEQAAREQAADHFNKQQPADWQHLRGLDLHTGGEFHKRLYDQHLPAAADKLFGRYGAKTEQVPLTVPDEDTGKVKQLQVHLLPLTPELRRAALQKGMPLFRSGGRVRRQQGGEVPPLPSFANDFQYLLGREPAAPATWPARALRDLLPGAGSARAALSASEEHRQGGDYQPGPVVEMAARGMPTKLLRYAGKWLGRQGRERQLGGRTPADLARDVLSSYREAEQT